MWQSAKLCKIVQSATVSCTDAIKTAWTTGWCLKLAQFVTAHHAWCMDMAELHWNSWHETQLLVVIFPGKQNLSLICLPAHDTFAGDICQVRTSLFSLEKMEKDPNNGSSTYKSSTCKYQTTAQVHESNTFFTDQSMNLKSGVLFKHASDTCSLCFVAETALISKLAAAIVSEVVADTWHHLTSWHHG